MNEDSTDRRPSADPFEGRARKSTHGDRRPPKGQGPNRQAGERGEGTKVRVLFNAERKQLFLDEFAKTARVTDACIAAGICRQTYQDHSANDPEFRANVELARQAYADILVKEVHRRGVTGVKEPVFWQGQIVGHVYKPSDRLLELITKRHVAEFRDRVQVDQKTELSGSLGLAFGGLSGLSQAARDKLRDVLSEAEGTKAPATATTNEDNPDGATATEG